MSPSAAPTLLLLLPPARPPLKAQPLLHQPFFRPGPGPADVSSRAPGLPLVLSPVGARLWGAKAPRPSHFLTQLCFLALEIQI